MFKVEHILIAVTYGYRPTFCFYTIPRFTAARDLVLLTKLRVAMVSGGVQLQLYLLIMVLSELSVGAE